MPISNLKILCVSLDPTVIFQFLTKTQSLNPDIEISRTFSLAKEKISQTNFDVYLFEIQSFNSEVDAIIQDIRKKEGKKAVIVLITNKSHKDALLAELKDRSTVDFVLEKPLTEKQVEEVLQKLIIKEPSPKEVLSPGLQVLKNKYDQTIETKLRLLSDLQVQSLTNPEAIKDFKIEIHKISGTAGSFGYDLASQHAKAMESEINKKLEDGSYKDVEWLNQIPDFIQKLKNDFNLSTKEITFSDPLATTSKKSIVYVVDNDTGFLELLERLKFEFNLELVVDFDPLKALERLKSPLFQPDCVVVSQNFKSTSINGLSLIQQIQTLHQKTAFVLLLEHDNLDLRIKALEEGVHAIFNKPVSAPILLKGITQILKTKMPNSLKVMIVDDDNDFCDLVSAFLGEIGITTFAVNESSDLFKALDKFRPDILLLDLIFPKYDGMNLLKTLRQDYIYKNLAIIMVTSSEQLEVASKAYAANVDDILFKPIDKKILQQRILNIAQRKVSCNETDSYTGLLQDKNLQQEINQLIKNPGHEKAFLILFEIQDYAKLIEQEGFSRLKNLLIDISNQIQWQMDHSMKCYLHQSSNFAIIYQGSNLNIKAVETKTYTFLSELAQVEREWHLGFNSCIVPISKANGNAANILEMAQEGLDECKIKEASVVKVISRSSKESETSKQEIVIVDSDADLLKILKRAFESQGFLVKPYLEGGDALKDILEKSETHMPALIIIERKLADMDGIELFRILQTRFRKIIPTIMLTLFSADKDISDGINQGVSEYVVKPFNISILVQKALRILEAHADTE
jgi:DNA-binding response OmpR family regulator/HPt (histidine-containing phosphotransfer) domain-containing protein